MLETSARLLKLLALLQTHRDWSGTELAAQLDVTPRTVRHDIERLRRLGYPVDATRGVAGEYRLGQGATMPPLLLDDDEVVAVVIGLNQASSAGVAGIEESSLRALAKLERILPARLQRRVAALRGFSVRVPPDTPSPQANAETLALLANACRDREKIRMSYRSHEGTETRRIVEPHRLVNWGRLWYLVAWDDDRDDWRTFRVGRIAKTDPTGLRFRERELPAPDIATYITGYGSMAGWKYRARFTVHASASVVLDRINPAVGIVEAIDDETCVLEAGSDSLETMAVYVGMLGLDFTVTEPPELIAHLAEIANRYHRAVSPRPDAVASS